MGGGDILVNVRIEYTDGKIEDYICQQVEEIGGSLKLKHIKYYLYKHVIYIPLGSTAIKSVDVKPWSLADDYDDTELHRGFISEFEKAEQSWWEKDVIAPLVMDINNRGR